MNYNKLSGVQFAYICNKNGYLYGYPAAKPFFACNIPALRHTPPTFVPRTYGIFSFRYSEQKNFSIGSFFWQQSMRLLFLFPHTKRAVDISQRTAPTLKKIKIRNTIYLFH